MPTAAAGETRIHRKITALAATGKFEVMQRGSFDEVRNVALYFVLQSIRQIVRAAKALESKAVPKLDYVDPISF